MRYVLLFLLAILCASAWADQTVRGYYRKDGTYVQPYTRSSPNQYRYDNYNSRGNVNPYTGKRGYERNEFSNPPAYNKSYPGNPYGNQYENPYGR